MRKAVFLTAFNRLPYLQEVLHSWEHVRGLKDWHFVAMIEPSPLAQQIKEEFEEFVARAGLTDFEIHINPQVYGVLHHPWVGFERLLKDYEFVVRAEDDLIVSEDILEYFNWAAPEFMSDTSVATIHAFSLTDGASNEATVVGHFSPLVWGTWRDRWVDVIGPSWDHDYSTFNGTPGNQSGWDWNLNSRIFPQFNLHAVEPTISRVNNIGIWGVHGTPDNFEPAPHFSGDQPPVQWRAADSTEYVRH